MTYTIDNLAAATATPSSTIRYYQTIGLLPPPQREGRRAVYTEEHRQRLRMIDRLQERGFSLTGISQLLEGQTKGATLDAILRGHGRRSEVDSDPDIHELVMKVFPEGPAAAPVQNAIGMGVLTVVDGRVCPTDEAFRPLATAILRLFELGLEQDSAMQLWASVSTHIGAIASEFHDAAEKHVYPNTPRDQAQVATQRLIAAAHAIVDFALDTALRAGLVGDD